MKTLTCFQWIFALSFIINTGVTAQLQTALVHNGQTTIFNGATQFQDAHDAAVNGDTIYLPGGAIASITIDKNLKIFGAGYHPDSTQATFKTLITANLVFKENADSALIQGVEVSGEIQTFNNHKVDYLQVSRCKFGVLRIQGDGSTPCNNLSVTECILTSVNLHNATYSLISNSFVEGQLTAGSNNSFTNNIFLYQPPYSYYPLINSVNSSSFLNNIIFATNYLLNSSNSNTFSNNIFAHTPSSPSNLFIDNYNNINVPAVFVNQSGNVFDFNHDYHLVSPGTYLGTDGSQVGVYGGTFPFKEGGVPKNPHIQMKNISLQTTPLGELNIHIIVKAQDQ